MIQKLKGHTPKIHESAFLAPNCAVIGKVTLAQSASVWYGAVLRGDEEEIFVGENSNVQDNATLHNVEGCPVILGKNVTVGHNAVVHGCKVGDGSMIGMGAVVLNGAEIGEGCIIAAGALVKEGARIPDGSLVVGVPGKIVRELSPEQRQGILDNAKKYVLLAQEYGEEGC